MALIFDADEMVCFMNALSVPTDVFLPCSDVFLSRSVVSKIGEDIRGSTGFETGEDKRGLLESNKDERVSVSLDL